MFCKAEVEAKMINDLVEAVCQMHPDTDADKVASRAAELLADLHHRDAARREMQVTDELIRARADCLIFFALVLDGWGKALRLPSGAVVAVGAPASFNERLGLPTRHRLGMASKRVRQTCPEEVTRYKQAWRDWREARRRYLATETEASWQWYCAGKGNRNSVAYRSRVDLARRGGEEQFRTRRLFRYTITELLPRLEERERAYKELQEAAAIMEQARERIFEKMGVPPALRL